MQAVQYVHKEADVQLDMNSSSACLSRYSIGSLMRSMRYRMSGGGTGSSRRIVDEKQRGLTRVIFLFKVVLVLKKDEGSVAG